MLGDGGRVCQGHRSLPTSLSFFNVLIFTRSSGEAENTNFKTCKALIFMGIYRRFLVVQIYNFIFLQVCSLIQLLLPPTYILLVCLLLLDAESAGNLVLALLLTVDGFGEQLGT